MSEVIIVEGPDGAGKSTLIQNYFPTAEYSVIHNGVYESPQNAYLAYFSQLSVLEDHDRIIFDRMHISQDIYGPIMRKEDRMLEMHGQLEEILMTKKAVVVLCYTPAMVNNWRLRKGGEEYIEDFHKYMRVVNEYHPGSIFEHTILPIVVYDYTNENANELVPLLRRIEVVREDFYGDE